ncbi:hypothetical protein PAEPH01_1708 [Pancytospora epiphaga]|nr:hypothetical protein PAEPH01_1708 [Pancytospora epiphaga]
MLVKKKDGSPRLCIDFGPINDITKKDAYPLPKIEDILDSLSGATVYTTLDATSEYHQIPIDQKNIEKTAFQTRSGLYKYTRMPFGLSNAPAAFQRAINNMFAEERGKFLQVYLDDIIAYLKSKEEHENYLKKVLEKLKLLGLVLKKKNATL